MKIAFWLLDINYEVGDRGAEVWLWGVDRAGKTALIIDRSFVTYFYAVVEENVDASVVIREIEGRQYPSIVKLEIDELSFSESLSKR